MAEIARLSSADLNNLAMERADSPMHQMVLATLDREPLLDSLGMVRIADVKAHVEARLSRVPQLRRILYRPGPFGGGPLWIDDVNFDIKNHVLLTTLPPPGGDSAATEFAALEMAIVMDRSRPLWKVWLLDGYSETHLGMLIKLHHALADGPAMVNILAQVFDLERSAFERSDQPPLAVVPPAPDELRRDNIHRWGRVLRKSARTLAHPLAWFRAIARTASALTEGLGSGRGAPRLSLNRPIGRSRKVAALRLGLAEVKGTAHHLGVTVNDVFLCVVVAGLRRVLTARGEPVSGRSVRVSVAVSLRGAEWSTSGNHVGTMIVPVPIDVESPGELLAAVAAATARAKTKQLPVLSTGLMVLLSHSGLTRAYTRRQHMINVLTTNLPGPPMPLYFAGARVYAPVALPPIAGNITVSFAALSYDDGLTLSLVADRDSWPDLTLLVEGMQQAWTMLGTAASTAGLTLSSGAFGTLYKADRPLPAPVARGSV